LVTVQDVDGPVTVPAGSLLVADWQLAARDGHGDDGHGQRDYR
jgi:hypothetical protein